MSQGSSKGFIDLLYFIHHHGLWLSWPFFLVGAFVTGGSIWMLATLGEKNRICTLPLVAEQVVQFDRAGPVELWLEGPLLSSRISGLSFELTREGIPVKGRRSWFRHNSSGFTRTRFLARRFAVAEPGSYVVCTQGLGMPRPEDENFFIVFTRPYLKQIVLYVVALILGAFLAIGSLVNFLLRLWSVKG